MTREEEIEYQAGNLSDFAIAHGAPWEEFYKGFKEGAKWADEHPVNHQDNKDLVLTWEDIEAIGQIFTDVFKDGFDVVTNDYYQEVSNRFNKLKGR